MAARLHSSSAAFRTWYLIRQVAETFAMLQTFQESIASSFFILISLFISYAVDFIHKNGRNILTFDNVQTIDKMLERACIYLDSVLNGCASQYQHC